MPNITRNIACIMLLACLVGGCTSEFAVKDVSPPVGVLGGGEPVDIRGTGFSSGMGVTVYFGTEKVDNVVVSSTTRMTISTPSSDEPKIIDVRVITDTGEEFLLKSAFRYIPKADMNIRDLGQRKSMREAPPPGE